MNCIVRKKCYKVWTFHSLNFIHKFWILKKCIIRILGAWNKGNNSTFLHVALAILFPVKWLRQTTTADLMRASYTSECCLRHPLLLSGGAAGSRAHLAVIEADKSQGTDPAGPRVPWLTTRWWSAGDLLSPSLPLCKQREHHFGFLIVFTSMRTSKNLLRGYFFSFLPRWDIAF